MIIHEYYSISLISSFIDLAEAAAVSFYNIISVEAAWQYYSLIS
jgi:hypothetical protein